MASKFLDYDGPTGLYVATVDGIKPLEEAVALAAMADSAMLTSLGHSEMAAEYQALVASQRERTRPAA